MPTDKEVAHCHKWKSIISETPSCKSQQKAMLYVNGATGCHNYHQIHSKHQCKILFNEILNMAFCLSGYATPDGGIILFVL